MTATKPRIVDPRVVQEAIATAERERADLQQQRAEVLLELADQPNNDDIHAAIAQYDTLIRRLNDKVDNLRQSLTSHGRRAAEAAVLKACKEGETLLEQAQAVAAGPMVAAAVKFDEACVALRQAHEELQAASRQAQRLVRDGLSPFVAGQRTRRKRNPAELVSMQHGTLLRIVDVLNSREGIELRLGQYAERCAESFAAQISYALHEAKAE